MGPCERPIISEDEEWGVSSEVLNQGPALQLYGVFGNRWWWWWWGGTFQVVTVIGHLVEVHTQM